MKGEYHRDNKAPPPQNMFSKFHQHQHQHQHQHHPSPQPSQQPQHFAITSHPFQLSNTSDEPETKKDASTTANDGASIESVKRPRGRRPGSKNKPKPPVIITREPEPAMAPYVLELPAATDIIDAVNNYCRKRNTGLCILTGSGTVTNVSLRQPTTASSGGTVTFHGRFDILSISATVFPSSSTMAPFANGFTISLAGPQGQIVGGAVSGPLMSAGPVFIIAASFNNPMYHRLPSEEEHSGGASGSVAASEQSPPAESMSMYSSHLPSDVIWAPTARQAQLHPPPY